MELHERLAPATRSLADPPSGDRFAEVKNRIHLTIIEDLGRQIFNTEIDPGTLRVLYFSLQWQIIEARALSGIDEWHGQFDPVPLVVEALRATQTSPMPPIPRWRSR